MLAFGVGYGQSVLSKSIKLEDQKRIEIRERSIAVLISCEEDKTELRNTNFHSKGKTAEKKSVSETEKTDIVTSDAEKKRNADRSKEYESDQTFSNDHKT